jgi:hypothetical protein
MSDRVVLAYALPACDDRAHHLFVFPLYSTYASCRRPFFLLYMGCSLSVMFLAYQGSSRDIRAKIQQDELCIATWALIEYSIWFVLIPVVDPLQRVL